MGSGDIGFLLGAIPGLTLSVRNMLRFKRTIGQAETLARARGETLEFSNSVSLKKNFLFSPRSFVDAGDGLGVRQAKEYLLTVRRSTLVGHLVGGSVIMIGAIMGTFLATGLWPDR